MGKKKRGHPDVEDVLARPWCYYCERDFEDLKLLISHQKAKHFKCDRCGRRLNTAGGLSVHLNQVHKETLSQVENALPNRQGLDVEIFGMEGIPQDILDQHRNRIIQNFYQAQEDRRIATGNPLPGQSNSSPRKKVKVETKEELLARLAEWRAQKKAKKEAPAVANGAADGRPAADAVPGQFNTPHQQGTTGFEQHPMQAHYQHGQYPYPYAAEALPSRPPGAIGAAPGQLPVPGHGGSRNDAARPQTDDIDELIRMAEAGIRPPQHPDEADDGDKKAKKEKKGRLVYDDTSVSPEEKMAALPRYAFRPTVTA